MLGIISPSNILFLLSSANGWFARWIDASWNKITTDNMKRCWRKVGIKFVQDKVDFDIDKAASDES
jgi:hypothetical protein